MATLAYVWHVTVCRVLNERPNVRPATRGRVLAAAAELEHRPNLAAAQPLVTSRSYGLAQSAAVAAGGRGGSAGLLPLVITGSLLSVLPLIAAFLVLQRYRRSGLDAGAVKQ